MAGTYYIKLFLFNLLTTTEPDLKALKYSCFLYIMNASNKCMQMKVYRKVIVLL